jgi:hypothetical protein
MTIQEKAIEQLERISSHLATIGEKEDYTDVAIQALEQTRWIPASEKLPEVRDDKYGDTSDDVLICVMDEDGYYSISTGFYGYYPNNGSYQGWWSVWTDGCDKLYSKDKVVAWMPLPQPYKESDNNES